jgi:Ca2+-binding RTX toxin-like protein
VNDLAPESRGPFVDARQLAFLEKLVDEAYFQRGIHPDPFSGAAAYLNRLLEYVFDHYSARFMSQVIGEEIYRFENGYTLDPGTKPGLKSAYVLREDEFEGIVGLKPSGLTALERLAEASEDPDYVWDIALRMIEFSVGVENLPPEDLTLLSEALSASGASSLATHTMTIRTVGESLNVSIQERSLGERMNDADNDGFLAGSPEKDLLLGDNDDEVLEGADGDDEIRGRGGNDRLAGQDGSDYLLGGQGSDVYVFELGDGIDVIRESSDRKARDVIRFGAGIAFDALILERRGNTDLLISIRDNPLDAVLIENQFNKNSGVEVLRFADGSEEDLVEGRDYSLNGTGGDDQMLGVGNGGGVNDSIRGLGGNDTILGKFGDDELDGGEGDDRIVGGPGADVLVGGPGNDILHGGQGNDDLQGGAGDDVLDGGPGDDLFRYQGGDDRLSDSRGQFDRLVIDHAPSTDATYHRVGNDLRIALRDGGSIRFVKHFSGARIETISYSDSDVETASVEFTNQGGEGDDRLFGSAGKDTLIGDAGNDFLKGGDSGDSLDGGHGDDELDAGDGDDVLNPGHGDDVAKGGAGDDHFLYSSGHDRYADRSGERDVVTLSHHYRSEQVELLRRVETPRDLKLEINEANSITLQGHFTTRGAFEEVNFEGTEDKIDLKSLRPTTMGSPDDDVLSGVKQSADGRDMLFGLAGNDRIAAGAGDDWLAGGPGSDRLEGGAGADVYFYAIGDGDDIIVDTGGNDVIRFDEGIVSEDLVFTEDERDLVIGLPAHGNSRIVLMGHLGKATRRIESLEFADGSIQNLVNPN